MLRGTGAGGGGGGSVGGLAIGAAVVASSMRNDIPLPRPALQAVSRPWCDSITLRLIASPRPRPPKRFREIE